MTFRETFKSNVIDESAADEFQRHAESAARWLLIAALGVLLLGFALAGLNVWNQHEQFGRLDGAQPLRFDVLNFFAALSTYALISAVLLAGGLLVRSLAWFHLAVFSELDDLYAATDNDSGRDSDDR